MCSPSDARGCGDRLRLARRPAAFTLIELLVALLLLSLVLSLVYGAFAQISGRAVQLRDELNERQELRLLVRMISDDLQAAQWLRFAASKSTAIRTGIVAETRFEGDKEFTRISFHTARPARFYRKLDPAADPHLHEVGYFVEPDATGEQLLLIRREDFYVDDDLEDGGVEVVLADHIEAFLVEFLEPDFDPNALEVPWLLRWDSPTRGENSRMPVAMRLTIARKDAQGNTLSEQIEFNLPASVKL